MKKVLVLSDTHLSDKFDEKKFHYLSAKIKQANQVILNGDFWDGFITTFDKFINSYWNHLFPLLKSRKTVYVYGNHDKKDFSDERVNLFCNIATEKYELKSGKIKFIFEHGNRLCHLFDESLGIRRMHGALVYAYEPFHRQIIRRFNKKLMRFVFERYNKKIKKKLKKELKPNEVFICGHTHYAEIDLKNNFANSGVNHHGLGQNLWIENGKITFEEEWYS
ncbi:MAG: metallophosphoesterase family protein [Candidatus Roizmanbacteria bacterium]|nr:MAG: metallophosphoesterase family protein [Candidatus Roizmanbacteria bacterium]